MFEVNSAPECSDLDQKTSSSKKTNRKPKPHSFASLTAVLQSWQPSDASASRRMLANEVLMMLEGRDYTCTKSCIPAVIVDKQYPVDLLHYHSEQDLSEFLARMLWMHQEFSSAIGILLGVPDEETAAKVEEAYESILTTDEDCVVLLM
jgi:TctA family transporter